MTREQPLCPLPDLGELLVDIPRWEYQTVHVRQTGLCRLRVWRTLPGLDTEAGKLAVVTEIPENPGMSVTNAAEYIIDSLHAVFPGPLVTMEHYHRSAALPGWAGKERLDRTWLIGHRPQWQPVWPVTPQHPEYPLHALWAEEWFHAITGQPAFDPAPAGPATDTLEG